jgi:ABC-type nitrate/sulfonate/bicarbonate transport system ATPase subunit
LAPDEAAPPKVELDAVSKGFGAAAARISAVETASFAVANGEFVSIVGPSGCGKSTLLNIIAGLDEPSSGQVLFDGTEVADRRRFCSYMFQKDLLFPWRTIEANVALGLEVGGVRRGEARNRARALLSRFGLGQFSAHYPSQLSGGMRQRVALMRTLLCDRPILLLDEPFAALDALTRSIMQEWLLSIWSQERRTILFITHDIDEAIFLSDRVLLMSVRPGRIRNDIRVPLERPRDHRMTTNAAFTRLKQLIRDEIYEESMKADRGQPLH